MKNILKKAAGAAALIVLALTIAGCGSKSAESLAKKALSNLSKSDSAAIESKTSMTAQMSSAELGEMSLAAEQENRVEYTNDPEIIYSQGSYKQKIDDTDLTTAIEEYQVKEDDKTVTYTKLEDFWMRMEGGTSIKSMSESILTAVAEKKGTAVLADETQQMEGQESYAIHAELPVGEIPEIMSTAEGLLGQVGSNGGQMPNIIADLWISKDTGLPVLMIIDMKACGNYLIQSIEGAAGEFSDYSMNITYKSFDTVKDLQLPQEAKDSAIDTSNLPSGDGSGIGMPEGESGSEDQTRETTGYDIKGQMNDEGKYEIQLESAGNVAYVGIPEGYQEDMSSLYHLSLINDSYERIDYTFADMYEADTIAEEYKEMMSYIKEDEMYSEINFSDTKTITAGGNQVSYICLTYTYGAAPTGESGTDPVAPNAQSGTAGNPAAPTTESKTDPAAPTAESKTAGNPATPATGSGAAGTSSGGEAYAEYLTWTVNNGILFTVQISGLKAPDDNLIKDIYENITFK